MYNKYRTQFEVIHMLETYFSPTGGANNPAIIRLKRQLRKQMKDDALMEFKHGKCVKQYDDGEVIVLMPILEASFNLPKDEVERLFEDKYEIRIPNSPYDCTGQPFTSWFKVIKRRGLWWVYHAIAYDF